MSEFATGLWQWASAHPWLFFFMLVLWRPFKVSHWHVPKKD